jgi:hypothetical protein
MPPDAPSGAPEAAGGVERPRRTPAPARRTPARGYSFRTFSRPCVTRRVALRVS